MPDAARAKSSALWMPGVGEPWPVNRDWGVVVVDPDPRTRAFYRGSLESAGYGVEDSADGPEALELIERVQPHVVVVVGLRVEVARVEELDALRQLPSQLSTLSYEK